MIATIDVRTDTASARQIAAHLNRCDPAFLALLSQRVEIGGYAAKIVAHAKRLEAWSDGNLIGLVAIYCNDQQHRVAHITSVSVESAAARQGIATNLLRRGIAFAGCRGMREISLEVAGDNIAAIELYTKCGFVLAPASGRFVTMTLRL